jgi:hypothetical protein
VRTRLTGNGALVRLGDLVVDLEGVLYRLGTANTRPGATSIQTISSSRHQHGRDQPGRSNSHMTSSKHGLDGDLGLLGISLDGECG